LFAFIQELLVDAIVSLPGAVTDDDSISDLLNETQANIDQCRSMLDQICYLQVQLTTMSCVAVVNLAVVDISVTTLICRNSVV